jgi:hypothetical protein
MKYYDMSFEVGTTDHTAATAVVRFMFGGASKFRALAYAMTKEIGEQFTANEMAQERKWGPSGNFGTTMKRAADVNMVVDHGLQKDKYSHPFSRRDSPLWVVVANAMQILGIDGAATTVMPEDLERTRRRLLRLERSLSV